MTTKNFSGNAGLILKSNLLNNPFISTKTEGIIVEVETDFYL